MNQTKDQQIIAKLAEICAEIFNANREYLAGVLPHKKGKKSSYTISEFITETKSLSLDLDFGRFENRDAMVSIEVEGYKMNFEAGDVFEMLYRFSKIEKVPKGFAFEMIDKSEIIKVDDMKKYVSKDPERLACNFVRFDYLNGYKVATDAHIMKIKAINKTNDAPIMVNANGVICDIAKIYPNYLAAIPNSGVRVNLTDEILKKAYAVTRSNKCEYVNIIIDREKTIIKLDNNECEIATEGVFELKNDISVTIRLGGNYCNLLAGEKFTEFFVSERNTLLVGRNNYSLVVISLAHKNIANIGCLDGFESVVIELPTEIEQPPVKAERKPKKGKIEQAQSEPNDEPKQAEVEVVEVVVAEVIESEQTIIRSNNNDLLVVISDKIASRCEPPVITARTHTVRRMMTQMGKYVAVFAAGVILSIFVMGLDGNSANAQSVKPKTEPVIEVITMEITTPVNIANPEMQSVDTIERPQQFKDLPDRRGSAKTIVAEKVQPEVHSLARTSIDAVARIDALALSMVCVSVSVNPPDPITHYVNSGAPDNPND